jgi:undecaprenol kinase
MVVFYHMKFITRNLSRLKFAFAGIQYARKTDFSFRTQLYGIGLLLALAFMIFDPLSHNEGMFLILAYVLILITELQNTSLEYALDHLHPELHHNIGRSKDMAAGAVLLAGFFLLVVLTSIIIVRV